MSLDNVKLHLVDGVDEAFKLMEWLSRNRRDDVIGIDIETTGLDKVNDRVRLVQIGDEDDGWAIPWEDWGGVVREVVRKYKGYYTGHNFVSFDWTFLDRVGVRVPRDRLHDTRPMAHILEPNMSTALKVLASRYVDARAAAMQEDLDQAIGARGGWTWATVPIDFQQYWTYGALDPVISARLFHHHKEAIKRDGSWKAYELELAVAWVIRQMEINGAHVDRAYAAAHSEKFVKYCVDVAQWVQANYGVAPGSDESIIEILKNEGFDFTKKTKSGARYALDKEVLESIDHPLAKAVLSRRQHQKIASTYLSHIIAEADADDLLHPSINPLGARTSRMTMSGPNLQNLPRTSENNPAATTVRNCYTTRYGGDGRMLFCDFDQIEMRGLAHMSQDPGLRAAFLAPGDFFVNLARQVFRDDTIHKKHPLRQRVKNVGYAKIYGAGTAKMALTAGIPFEEMDVSVKAFDAEYRYVKMFQQRVYRTAMERKQQSGVGYVRSPLTGRRHPSDDGKEYALVNYLVQGLAAEMFKMKLVELDNAGLLPYMILPVHDEIILDVPNSVYDEAVHTLKEVMNDQKLLSIPVTAGLAFGERWGAKVDID